MIFEKLLEIFDDILESVGNIELDTKRDDVDGWDSLATINLLVAIEEEFNVKLTMEEVEKSFDNVKSIVKIIENKVSVEE